LQRTLDLPPGFFVGGKYMMKYVYESPDGGDTVYRRLPGQTERKLYKTSDRKKQQELAETKWAIWKNVVLAADHNPALQEALDRARVIYELTKND